MVLEMWVSDVSQTYYVKGHVNTDEFKEAVNKKENNDCGENRFKGVEVKHEWFKVVPDSTGEHHCMYYPSNKNVKGAFKATTVTIY